MTDSPMDRFEQLAEAYGGDVTRWPQGEREAAAAEMARDPQAAARILAQASELDALLASVEAPQASGDLMGRVLSSAPSGRRRWAWLLPAGMGAGLAAACVAGVVLGAQLSAAPAVSDGDSVVAAVSDEDAALVFEEGA